MSFPENLNRNAVSIRARNDREHSLRIGVFRGNVSLTIFGPRGAGIVFSNPLSLRSVKQMNAVLVGFAEKGSPATRTVELKGKFNPETRTSEVTGSMTLAIDEKGLPYIGVSCSKGSWQFPIYPPEPNFMGAEEVSRAENLRASIISFFDELYSKLTLLGVLTNEAGGNRGGGNGGGNRQGGGNRGNWRGGQGGGGGWRNNNGGSNYGGGQKNNYGGSSGGGYDGGNQASQSDDSLDDEVPF